MFIFLKKRQRVNLIPKLISDIINFRTMKKTNYAAWGVILAAIPMLVGCSEDNDANRTGKPTEIPLSGETRTLVDKGNQFCLDLLSAVSQENDDNFVISPGQPHQNP